MTTISILNTILIIVIIISALIIVFSDDLFTNIISIAVIGLFVSMEFMILGAFNAAVIEGISGMILIPLMFTFTIKKIKAKEDSKKRGELR